MFFKKIRHEIKSLEAIVESQKYHIQQYIDRLNNEFKISLHSIDITKEQIVVIKTDDCMPEESIEAIQNLFKSKDKQFAKISFIFLPKDSEIDILQKEETKKMIEGKLTNLNNKESDE